MSTAGGAIAAGAPGHVWQARAREAAAKAGAYDLLALAFAPPTEELSRAVARGGGPIALPEADPAALALEHTRVFVGPGRAAAPPWGSVYHDGGVLMGESTMDVLRHYRQAGFTFAPERGELPDHVIAELGFLSVLAEEEARAWEAGDEPAAWVWLGRRGAFLCDHLAAWGPELSQRILSVTIEPFYRALAVSLRELVAVDLECLTNLVAAREEAARAAAAPTKGEVTDART